MDKNIQIEIALQNYKKFQKEREQNYGCLISTFQSNIPSQKSSNRSKRETLDPIPSDVGEISSTIREILTKPSTKAQLMKEREEREKQQKLLEIEEKKKQLKQWRLEDKNQISHSKQSTSSSIDSKAFFSSGTSDSFKSNHTEPVWIRSGISQQDEISEIQIRHLDGSLDRVQFSSSDLLVRICEYVSSKNFSNQNQQHFNPLKDSTPISLTTPFPRKTFTLNELNELTMKDAGFVPNGSVIVIKSNSGWVLNQKSPYEYSIIHPKWKLKGESVEAKDNFKKKMQEIENLKRIEDRKQSVQSLKKVRMQIKNDFNEKKKQYNEREEEKRSDELKSISNIIQSLEKSNLSTIQVRLPNSSVIKVELPFNSTLDTLRNELVSNHNLSVTTFSFLITFPRKEFKLEDFPNISLKDAGLVPKGNIIVNVPKNNDQLIQINDYEQNDYEENENEYYDQNDY